MANKFFSFSLFVDFSNVFPSYRENLHWYTVDREMENIWSWLKRYQERNMANIFTETLPNIKIKKTFQVGKENCLCNFKLMAERKFSNFCWKAAFLKSEQEKKTWIICMEQSKNGNSWKHSFDTLHAKMIDDSRMIQINAWNRSSSMHIMNT